MTTIDRLKAHLMNKGIPWRPEYDVSAIHMAYALDQAIKVEQRAVLEADNQSLLKELFIWRILAREWMAEFYIIPEDRIHLAPLDSSGRDEDLKKFFVS